MSERGSSFDEADERSPFRPMASAAIPIPDAGSSSESSSPSSPHAFFLPSPGAHSAVVRPESWRPMPPPMLASSFDSRVLPSLRPTEPPARPREVPAGPAQYGAAAVAAAAEALRASEAAPKAPPRHVSWRAKLSKALVHTRALSAAPRELWLIFALKLLSSYAYFSFSLILVVFLSNEYGLSDTAAGWAYGVYGVMSTFFGFVCGWFIDYMGVRLSLLLGALVGAISRLVIALTVSRHTAMLVLYTLLPFAECLGIPIMTIGVKRYTNPQNRTFAFSLYYSMMNVAALIAGPAVDASRHFFRNGIEFDLRDYGFNSVLHLTGLRVVVLSSALATAAMCFVIFLGVREIEVDSSGNITSFAPNRESPVTQTWTVLQEPAFWRLTLLTVLLVAVRLVFRHLDATLPKYLVRQFGPNAPFGLVFSINPLIIIILVPIVGLMTRGVDSFRMILYGSFVAAASPFWICLAPSYWTVVLFMITLSIGEAVYSPRVYEYTMQVSGRGAEGLYSSLSSAPLFSVKLLVGGMSGWLLSTFMPAIGRHRGSILWGIIGLTSLTSPILMFLCQGYITGGEPASDAVGNAQTAQAHRARPSGRRRAVSHKDSALGTPGAHTPLMGSMAASAARPPAWKPSPAIDIDYDDEEEEDENDALGDRIVAVGGVSNTGQSPHSMPRGLYFGR